MLEVIPIAFDERLHLGALSLHFASYLFDVYFVFFLGVSH
jgi:hypothetical protein